MNKVTKKCNIRCGMHLKMEAARRALSYVRSGMVIGIGTGSTMRCFIDQLGEALEVGSIQDIRGVPTSMGSAAQAQSLGIPLTTLADYPKLDLAIDGADEVDPNLDLIKGMGGALLREKIVGIHADHFLLVVDDTKMVTKLGLRVPLPVEILPFEAQAHMNWLENLGCQPNLKYVADGIPFLTDNGNYIALCRFSNGIDEPNSLAQLLADRPGIIEHGLFLKMAHKVIVSGVEGTKILERET